MIDSLSGMLKYDGNDVTLLNMYDVINSKHHMKLLIMELFHVTPIPSLLSKFFAVIEIILLMPSQTAKK